MVIDVSNWVNHAVEREKLGQRTSEIVADICQVSQSSVNRYMKDSNVPSEIRQRGIKKIEFDSFEELFIAWFLISIVGLKKNFPHSENT